MYLFILSVLAGYVVANVVNPNSWLNVEEPDEELEDD